MIDPNPSIVVWIFPLFFQVVGDEQVEKSAPVRKFFYFFCVKCLTLWSEFGTFKTSKETLIL